MHEGNFLIKNVRNNKTLQFLTLITILCAFPLLASAQTNSSWKGGTGNWSTSGDWNPSGVPNNGGGNTYNVTIATGKDVVILNQNATINSLTIGLPTGHTLTSALEEAAGAPETLTVTGNITVNETGLLDVQSSSTFTAANLTNSGYVATDFLRDGMGSANTLTITGTFTNNAGATLDIGQNGESDDVVNIGTLSNSGTVRINAGDTLNLTNQMNGITDVVAGSVLDVAGNFTAGSSSAFANLTSVEGNLRISNGQSLTITPNGGTLTINGSGLLSVGDLSMRSQTTLKILGNVNNSATGSNTGFEDSAKLTVTGTVTNQAGAQFTVESLASIPATANIGTLVNNGSVVIGQGATLNLTNQPNGITDVIGGSSFTIDGTFKAGSNNALAQLNSVEGMLSIENGQTAIVTPGSGTLTISGTGSLTVSGASTLTVSGTLSNNGFLFVDDGATLNLPNQPNGITDVVAGSTLLIDGTINAGGGSNNGLANLNSVEGSLSIGNGTTVTPGSGTLTVSKTGNLSFGPMTVSGNLTNAGTFSAGNNVIITGAFTNSGKASVGGSFTLEGGVINNTGNMTVGDLVLEASSTTLSGKGKLMLSGIITASSANDVLINQSTIIGSGMIGNGSMGLVNNGTIASNDPFGTLTIGVSSAGFNNQGTLEAELASGKKGNPPILKVTGPANSFLNFNSSTGTLTGGTYEMINGTIQFDGANIITNNATIILDGAPSQIIDQNGDNGLANFSVNGSKGSFAIGEKRNFTTSGAFSNAGKLTINTGSTFTVGGSNNYTQTAGTTTVSGALVTSGVNVSGGSVFGVGTITGNIDLTGGLLSAGAATKKAGDLTLNGSYTQSGSGDFVADLGGTTAGTKYDVLNISGAATLGGTLTVDLISSFKPTVGESFDIMNYSSETGTFSTLSLPKLTGGDTWQVSYNATDLVITVEGPAATSAHNNVASTVRHAAVHGAAIAGDDMRAPSAILTRAETCGGFRTFASFACMREAVSGIASGFTHTVASHGTMAVSTLHNNVASHTNVASVSGVHNNVASMVRPHSNAMVARGASMISHETTVSATSVARFYVCAYMPDELARTMGCR